MFNTLKKAMFAFVLLLMVASTGAWQSSSTALAADGGPATPLAPGLTWKDVGPSVRDMQLNIKGDALKLSGETFQAGEKFTDALPKAITDFYSNVALYKSGWSSDNAFEDSAGTHLIFYHASGYYLAVEYLKCADDANSTCITVWKSAQKDTAKFIEGHNAAPAEMGATVSTFGKLTPANNSVNINPGKVYLSWSSYVDLAKPVLKYSYCVQAWEECAHDSENWTGTFTNTSINITGLDLSNIYYWQVKAILDPDNVVPKTYVLADGINTPWKFTTTTATRVISGYVGVGGAYVYYVDTSVKRVISASNGYYAFTVPLNWSGSVQPAKAGVVFTPIKKYYSKVTVNYPNQNYTAKLTRYTISGDAGIASATLTYVEGSTTKTVLSDINGHYSFTVPYRWSGKVTPSRVGVASFGPTSRTYTYVLANFANQNYRANILTTFIPIGAYDGYVTESNEVSDVGGAFNSTAQYFLVGDSVHNQQIRSILSYNTTPLPDNAVILSAKLKLKSQAVVGTNPFDTHGLLLIDIKHGYFGAAPALGADDFAAPSSLDIAGSVGKNPSNGYYIGTISATAFQYIHLKTLTQFRLEFQLDDNDDGGQDTIAFYSGNTTVSTYRPVLEIVYYVP